MSDAKQSVEHRKLSTLTVWGFVFTAGYLVLCIFLVFCRVGWSNFINFDAGKLGDIFAGFVAPLAFLWLIIGFFQQGIELRNQIEETRRLASATEGQLRSELAKEEHAKKELFAQLLEKVTKELESIASRILLSCKVEPIKEHRKWAERSVSAGYRDGYLTELVAAFERYRTDFGTDQDGEIAQILWWAEQLKAAECDEEVSRYLDLSNGILGEANKIDPGGSLELLVRSGRAHRLGKIFEKFRKYEAEIAEHVPGWKF